MEAWYLGGTSNDYCLINTGNKLSQYNRLSEKKQSQYNNKTYILRNREQEKENGFRSYTIEVIELIECLKLLDKKKSKCTFFYSFSYAAAEII